MIIWPGLRRVISAIQRIFNSASFYAPLTHSLVLERGTGSPTFTRASTATFTDWEGVLRTVPSGCARFEGGRMVRNLNPNSQAIASWTRTGCTVSSDVLIAPDGTSTADAIFETIANAPHASYNTITIGNGMLTYSVYLKKNGRDYVAIGVASALAYFNLATGVVGTVGGAGAVSSAISDEGDGWYRCSLKVSGISGNQTTAIYCASADNVASYAGDITKGVYAWGAQLEDVTGQADQTASEYVSVGVESAPYHGAGVDGVAFFDTDRDGNPISGAILDGYLSDASSPPDVLAYQTNGNITASAGWIYLEYTPSGTPSGTVFLWGTYVDANNYTAILHDATNLIFRKRIAATNYDATIANAFVADTTYKMAATWGAGGTAITLDGVAGTPHANTTAAQIAATMQWGADGNGGNQPGMALAEEHIGQRALSSSELRAITS